MAKGLSTVTLDRQKVMTAAWATYRNRFAFAGIKFGSADFLSAFAWSLREAWRRVREAAALALTTVASLASRLADAVRSVELAGYGDSFGANLRETTAAREELAALRATASLAGVQLAA